MQMDKPYMIEQNNLITTSHGWYEEPFAVFGADALLCAFVSLRIISSEILELVSPYRDRHIPLSDILMKMLNSNITRWEEHWLHISEDGGYCIKVFNFDAHATQIELIAVKHS
jgi:hypothetical protein